MPRDGKKLSPQIHRFDALTGGAELDAQTGFGKRVDEEGNHMKIFCNILWVSGRGHSVFAFGSCAKFACLSTWGHD